MKNKIVTIGVSMLTSIVSMAQLTLEECKKSAIEHNISMQKQMLEMDDAELQKKEAFTNFFPQVSALGAAVKFDKPQVEMDMTAMVGAPAMLTMLEDGVIGAVNAQWPVFVGGQIVNGNKLAKLNYTVKQLQMVQTQNEVSLTAEQYYWQVVSLEQKLSTLRKQSEMLGSIVQDAQNAVDAGLSNKNDLLQAQLQQNKVESGIITIEGNLKLCKMLLAQYCGLWNPSDSIYDTSKMTLASSIGHNQLASPEEIYVEPSRALAETPEYALANEGLKAQQLQYKMERGAHMPTVAIGGSYSYTNLMRNDMGVGENNKNTLAVYAMVSVPLTDWWSGSYKMTRKKNAVRASELDLQNASQMLVVRMQSAYTNLCTAYQQVDVARRSIEQANENLRLEQDYYQAGTSTMSDLLKAQSSLQQANDDYVDAWATYQEKRLEYMQATGR